MAKRYSRGRRSTGKPIPPPAPKPNTKVKAVVPYEKTERIKFRQTDYIDKRKTALVAIISVFLVLLVTFTLVLYPLNEARAYKDQEILSVEEYLSRLGQTSIYVPPMNLIVHVNQNGMGVLASYSHVYLPDYIPEDVRMIESLNSSTNFLLYPYKYLICGELYETKFATGSDGISFCYVEFHGGYIDVNAPPSFQYIAYSFEMLKNGEIEGLGLFSRFCDYLGDSIWYGLRTTLKVLPFGVAKPRTDFNVNIPWREEQMK